ncbi:MAG: VWA domain-containing protein [Treponema sp.]|jgi:hypothetical protein|nr:VWA domain-containing protein [Treponema sp.]
MNLNIIIDTSGSMADMAKSQIERLALDSIVCYAGHFMRDLRFHVFLWNESFSEAAVETVFQPGGEVLFAPLAEYFNSAKNISSQNGTEGLLLLSDGCWNFKELEVFLEETREKRPALSALAIGSDANFLTLEKIAGQGKVFHADDVLAALESCFSGSQKEAPYVE